MENNNGKLALVTGGNRGIGFSIAQGLLQKGLMVIITARSLDKAKQAAEKLEALFFWFDCIGKSKDGEKFKVIQNVTHTWVRPESEWKLVGEQLGFGKFPKSLL